MLPPNPQCNYCAFSSREAECHKLTIFQLVNIPYASIPMLESTIFFLILGDYTESMHQIKDDSHLATLSLPFVNMAHISPFI